MYIHIHSGIIQSISLSLAICTLCDAFRLRSVLFASGSVNIHSHFLRLNGEDGWGDRCVECYSKCTLNAHTIHFLSFLPPRNLLFSLYAFPHSVFGPILPPSFPHTLIHTPGLYLFGSLSVLLLSVTENVCCRVCWR